jgi:hypothetical protein
MGVSRQRFCEWKYAGHVNMSTGRGAPTLNGMRVGSSSRVLRAPGPVRALELPRIVRVSDAADTPKRVLFGTYSDMQIRAGSGLSCMKGGQCACFENGGIDLRNSAGISSNDDSDSNSLRI